MTDTTLARITGFEFHSRTRYVFGVGCVERVGELGRELGGGRALIVTDAGIVAAGHGEMVRDYLQRAGLEVLLYDGVRENPTMRDVDACLAVAREARTDLIVGLGGGSSMDTAKGCSLLLANGGRLHDYWRTERRSKPTSPLIAVPTTAGTGSESQTYALIADETTHQKMAIGDPMLAVDVAVLDPRLTLTQPPYVTACSGLDALAHALETAVTTRRNAMSRLFSREAFVLIYSGLPRVLSDPGDLEARADMQLGASYAGMAIECGMLGAAHAAANPLTSEYGVVHGQAVSVMLPHVVRLNAKDAQAGERYRELAAAVGLLDDRESMESVAETLASAVETLLDAGGMKRSLEALGVAGRDLPRLSEMAASQWTARFNPVSMDAEAFMELYRRVM